MQPLIVGNPDDVHVRAVLTVLEKDRVDPRVFDVESLASGRGWPTSLLPEADQPRVRGWIRRLAPPGWAYDVTPSSHEGAKVSAWSTLVTGLVLSARCRWLTPLPALLAAENKLLQLATARQLGIAVPQTLVARSVDELRMAGLERCR